MRRVVGWAFIGLFFLACLHAARSPARAEVSLGKKVGDPYAVIDLVNQVRAGYGLGALQPNAALMSAAQGHSEYQASVGSTTHSGAGGSSPLNRAVGAGYGGGAKVYLSENIYGGNNATPQIAVNWWQGDALHLNTIINSAAQDVGAGVATGGSVVYYTLDVGYISGSAGSGNPPQATFPAGQNPPPTNGPIALIAQPIKAATASADGSIIHVVQPGQALWSIAAVYKIPLADLLAQNGMTSNPVIHPGDKIVVRPAQTTSTSASVVTLTGTLTSPSPPVSLPPQTQVVSTADFAWQISPTVLVKTAEPVLPSSTVTVTVSPPSRVSTRGLDPILLTIIGLILVSALLILFGSLMQRRS
jgi:LysM repeat protein